MSNPSSFPRADKAMEAFSFALWSCSSGVLGLSAGGKQKTCWAKPFLLTKSRRDSLMSIAAMREAPRLFARPHARIPIAPAPRTRTEWPLVRPARREAWTRTERGSARAAFSYEQLAGKLREIQSANEEKIKQGHTGAGREQGDSFGFAGYRRHEGRRQHYCRSAWTCRGYSGHLYKNYSHGTWCRPLWRRVGQHISRWHQRLQRSQHLQPHDQERGVDELQNHRYDRACNNALLICHYKDPK